MMYHSKTYESDQNGHHSISRNHRFFIANGTKHERVTPYFPAVFVENFNKTIAKIDLKTRRLRCLQTFQLICIVYWFSQSYMVVKHKDKQMQLNFLLVFQKKVKFYFSTPLVLLDPYIFQN
jgi:hypothetical protein